MTAARHVFTDSLPDLIDASEYADHPDGGLVRIHVSVTEDGVEILGDGLRPELIEQILTAVSSAGDGPMEQMLCG